jgi:hypothetical protein
MDGRLAQHGRTHSREWFAEDWVRELVKHLAPAAQVVTGVSVETQLGPYQLDLLVQLGALRVGFSREGGVSCRDLEGVWRDAALLGPGGASVIYRVRPVDLQHHQEDCLYAVLRCDPRLFSNRGSTLVSRLASETIQRARFPREEMIVYYPPAYDEEMDVDPSGDAEDVIVEARPRETEESLFVIRRERGRLRGWYEYLRRSRLRTAEEVMLRFAAENLAASDLDG